MSQNQNRQQLQQQQKSLCNKKKRGRKFAKLYKDRYFIVFYDKTDEELRYMFDNVREILKFLKLDINNKNINRLNVELYLALKNPNRLVYWLDPKEPLRVYLIDETVDSEELFEENII